MRAVIRVSVLVFAVAAVLTIAASAVAGSNPQLEPVLTGESCETEASHVATPPGEDAEMSPIRFFNQSGRSLEIFWINYEGVRVYYYQLAPDESYVQGSYRTHSWIVADRTTGECLGIFRNANSGTWQARVTGVLTPTPPVDTPGPAAPEGPEVPLDPGAPMPVEEVAPDVASGPPAPRRPRGREPYVRFRARVEPGAVKFLKLIVVLPTKARVSITCAPGCRVRKLDAVETGPVNLMALVRGRRLGLGSKIEIAVTRPNRVGRYFRYQVSRKGLSGITCALTARSGKRLDCQPEG